MVITEKVSYKNIPVVYWFMFDEHFLVWLDILFIFGSRDIKFSNMKWEKNIWDVENCKTLAGLCLKINLEEYNGLSGSKPFFTPIQDTIETRILPLVLKLMGTIYIIMEGMNRHLAMS